MCDQGQDARRASRRISREREKGEEEGLGYPRGGRISAIERCAENRDEQTILSFSFFFLISFLLTYANARLDTRPRWSAFLLPLSAARSRSRQRNVTSDDGENEALGPRARTRTAGRVIHVALRGINLRHNPRASALRRPRDGYWWPPVAKIRSRAFSCLPARAAAATSTCRSPFLNYLREIAPAHASPRPASPGLG